MITYFDVGMKRLDSCVVLGVAQNTHNSELMLMLLS